MKTDGRLARCPLKGVIGDAIFAVLCGCGHNIRKILAHLRAILALVIAAILANLSGYASHLQVAKTA
jgi:transposase, IS5 family